MGKGGKVTIGYWYHPAFHICLHNGPMDALIQVRGGDYTAWSGPLTASGTITIDVPGLWGGTAAEGGIQGDMDVMFGDEDQAPNSAIDSLIAPDGSAHRGKACVLFKGGRYGAMNPYPKPVSFLTARILKGWDNDDCWYPQKAVIVLSGVSAVDFFVDDTSLPCPNASNVTRTYSFSGVSPSDIVVFYKPATGSYGGWSAWGTDDPSMEVPTPPVPGSVWVNNFTVTGVVVDSVGTGGPWTYTSPFYSSEAAAGAGAIAAGELLSVTGYSEYNITITDNNPADDRGGLSLSVGISSVGINAMNPAHIIYESLTCSDMGSEPIENVNDTAFRAAADELYTEGLGLCTLYDPDQETIEQFRERICTTAAMSCSRSSIDGLWYLDLIRGGGNPSLLPTLTDDDILDYHEDGTTQDDAVNQVAVQWFDPVMKQQRTTAPVQAVGAIENFEVVNGQVNQYLEIPTETLALRAAGRDLAALSLPLSRLTLTTNRVPYGWRQGTYFVLNAPKRGIESAVFLVGDIDRGTLKSGAIQLKAVQDNYSMPSATYVVGELGNSAPPRPPLPLPVQVQLAFELPYAVLAQNLTTAQLGDLDATAGYLGIVGVRPQTGTAGYDFDVAVGGGAYASDGSGDWCPTATASAAAGPFDTSAVMATTTDLQYVQTGTLAIWDNELVRVDAVDTGSNTVTLGRGCVDSVSAPHVLGSRLYFAGGFIASDQTEYVSGEVINVELLTRTSGSVLSSALAIPVSVTMAGRQALPYPPQMLMVNGTRWDLVTGVQSGLALSWVRRNRISQADQLIDCTAADIAPETGTTFTVTIVDQTGARLVQQTGIAGTAFTWNPTGSVQAKVSVAAVTAEGTSSQVLTSLLMAVGNNTSAPSGGGSAPGLIVATGGHLVQVLVGALPNLFIASTVSAAMTYSAQWQDSPDGNAFTNRSTSGAPISVASLWPYSIIAGSKIYLPAYVSDDANWYDSPWSALTLTSANFPNLAATLLSTGTGSIGGVGPPSQIWDLNGQWVAVGYLYLTLTPLGILLGNSPIQQYVIVSPDGATWTDLTSSSALPNIAAGNALELRWDSANSRYLIFVTSSAALYTSTDLNTLTLVPGFATATGAGTNLPRTRVSIAMDGVGNIIAVGFGWSLPDGHTVTTPAPWIVRSTNNGTSWAPVTYTGPNPPVGLSGVLWDGGQFIAKGIGVLGTSPDGSTWTWASTGDIYEYNWATNGAHVTLYQEYDAGTFSFGPILRKVGSTPLLDETGANILDESGNNILSD